MATLFVDKVDPQSGTSLEIGSSGDTVALGSGVTQTIAVNTPAFLARLTSHQTISDDTMTKIQFNTEVYDTANAYDNSTNYRFTVPSGQAGKYFYYSSLTLDGDVSSNLDSANINPRLNGSSAIGGREFIFYNNPIRLAPVIAIAVLDLSVGDYLEVFARIEASDATGGRVTGDFGAYKIIE